MNTAAISPFAAALKNLFDTTNFYSRAEWSRFLRVDEAVISTWVTDQAVPTGDKLSMMLDLLRLRGTQQVPLVEFDTLAQRPSTEVSPFGDFLAPTVATYLKQSTFLELGKSIRHLSRSQQQRVLKGSWDPDSIKTYMQSK